MKTFDEAVNCVNREVASVNEIEEASQAIQDTFERYAEVAMEAFSHPKTQHMLLAWSSGLSNDPQGALFSAFMSGLVVGIEMEKSNE